jgi:CheY-like chemotaxis protein
MTSPALRVLIVEDEMTVALLMEDLLVELGHEVVGMAMRLPLALALAERLEFDLAILDINLDGQMSFAVADILVAREVPFFFASGYGAPGLELPYRNHRMLPKPFDRDTLHDALQAHFDGRL